MKRALFRMLLGLGLLALGCQSAEGPKAGGETNWLELCESDADCVEGRCVCGACTQQCVTGANACSGGPPGSACFADGSVGHLSLCDRQEATGVCLNSCRDDLDCGPQQACSTGVCVPLGAQGGNLNLPGRSMSGPTGSNTNESQPEPITTATVVSLDACEPSLGGEIALSCLCSSQEECPTLEQVLASQECWQVRRGCGLVVVEFETAEGGTSYWFESETTQPVGVRRWTVAGGEYLIARSRNLFCPEMSSECGTCAETPEGASACVSSADWFSQR